MIVNVEARRWIQESDYEVPERMPHVGLLYKAGASYVGVAEYSELSGRMVLDITFPDDLAEAAELWFHIANCGHDGVKREAGGSTRIKMLILSYEDHVEKQANGPYGGLTEW